MRIENRTKRRGRSHSAPRIARRLLVAGVFGPVLWMLAASASAFSAADVYRNASPSVVLIFGFEDNGAGNSGTGTIISRDGLVLTNNHVIATGKGGRLYSNLVVYLKPTPISGDNTKDLTKPYLVEIIARDVDLDLALLRVKNPPRDLRAIEVGDSEEVEIGENVAAIGHPGGGGLWTLTTGTVSSKRRDQFRDIFQTDTAINPGNSGGPLLDENARLIGVNTFVRRVNDDGLPLEGLNYSLRSSLALAWVNRQGVSRIRSVSRAERSLAHAVVPPTLDPNRREEATAPRTAEARPNPDPDPAPAQPRVPRLDPLAELTPPALAPTPSYPPPAPRSAHRRSSPPPPPIEPRAREFTTPDGTRMYGVPNLENDLPSSLRQARRAYRELTKRRDASIQEMEERFDDYDNF